MDNKEYDKIVKSFMTKFNIKPYDSFEHRTQFNAYLEGYSLCKKLKSKKE